MRIVEIVLHAQIVTNLVGHGFGHRHRTGPPLIDGLLVLLGVPTDSWQVSNSNCAVGFRIISHIQHQVSIAQVGISEVKKLLEVCYCGLYVLVHVY